MAVNRHITASAYPGGNFAAGRLPTIQITLLFFSFLFLIEFSHKLMSKIQPVVTK